MIATIAVPVLLSSAIFYISYTIVYNLFISPLRRYPGPLLYAVSPIPWMIDSVRGNSHSKIFQLHQQYGPSVRLSPTEVSFTSPLAVKDVLAHRQGHDEFSKTQKIPNLNGRFGILSAERDDHARYRRLLSHSFSDRVMRSQEPIIQSYADLLVNGLAKKTKDEDGEAQDLVTWLNWTTFDIISRLAFGSSFGCLETQSTHSWISALFGNAKVLQLIGSLKQVGLQAIVPWLIWFGGKDAAEIRQRNWKYASDKIETRVQGGKENGDFWDYVLEKSDGETGKGMDIEEMKVNAANLVLAGSETTATLLSGCIFLLTQHPEALAKATKEVRDAFSSLDEVNLLDVEANLPYILAILNETLRLYPPVPNQMLRTAPKGGDTVLGQYLPEGTVISVCQYAVNRSTSNFTRAEEFIPERFLADEKDSEFLQDNPAAMQPFSMGPRNCIGKNLAYAEMRLLLAKLLWKFDFELDERSKEWTEGQKTYVLWEKPPLWVKLHAVH